MNLENVFRLINSEEKRVTRPEERQFNSPLFTHSLTMSLCSPLRCRTLTKQKQKQQQKQQQKRLHSLENFSAKNLLKVFTLFDIIQIANNTLEIFYTWFIFSRSFYFCTKNKNDLIISEEEYWTIAQATNDSAQAITSLSKKYVYYTLSYFSNNTIEQTLAHFQQFSLSTADRENSLKKTNGGGTNFKNLDILFWFELNLQIVLISWLANTLRSCFLFFKTKKKSCFINTELTLTFLLSVGF